MQSEVVVRWPLSFFIFRENYILYYERIDNYARTEEGERPYGIRSRHQFPAYENMNEVVELTLVRNRIYNILLFFSQKGVSRC